MKGMKKGCYAAGGSVSKTRDIGITAPREGCSTKIIAEAKKGSTGMQVEGKAAAGRTDRPARRMGGKCD